jgi:membrane protein
LREITKVLVSAIKAFGAHNATMLAAGLAFYTSLSLAPLVVLLMWFSGALGPDTQAKIVEEVVGLVGEQAGEGIRLVMETASDHPTGGSLAGLIAICALLFAATNVFAQLQRALNLIWGVQPRKGALKVVAWLRKRAVSLLMVVTLGGLLLVSLALSTLSSLLPELVAGVIPGGYLLVSLLNTTLSFALTVALFEAVFKILPDVKVGWREVLFGALGTALLFALGKWAIGLYLGQRSLGAAYGAAGSLVVLLAWVYYSSIILFFGAELTKAWRMHHDLGRERAVEPEDHAEIDPHAVEVEASASAK